jgi:GNAT superfamily N-acetyltransferase
MVIRNALEKDLPSVLQIYRDTAEASSGPVEFWRALIPAQGLLVAEEGGRIVGFGTFDVAAPEPIRHLYVAPNFQGRGAGLEILGELEGRARSQGLIEIRLHAAVKAVAFYRRAGYNPIAPNSVSTHDHEGVFLSKRL